MKTSKSVSASVAGAAVLEGVPTREECTGSIFDKRDSLVMVVFFHAISAFGGLHHGGRHRPSKSCRPITICSPTVM
jgi:hypothetical protein